MQAVLQCDARAVVRASPSPVVAISLTTNGLPCLTLANAHAFAYHTQMQEWMRVADWGFPASAHHSVMSGGAAGEISSLLAAAEAQRSRAAVFDAMQVVRICRDSHRISRAAFEVACVLLCAVVPESCYFT